MLNSINFELTELEGALLQESTSNSNKGLQKANIDNIKSKIV